jgi:hypothetical protein
MTRRLVLSLVVLAGVVGALAGPALADPPTANGHNCAGFTSAFVPPGIGPGVSALAHLFPAAIPTLTDAANCGDNGNGL